MHHHSVFTIKQLHTANQVAMTTAIAVLVASLVVTAMLPTLLIRYVYAGQQLFEQPVVLQYIPVVSFVVGMGYFVVAVVGNILRSQRIRRLNQQLELENSLDGCCGHCNSDQTHETEMAEVSSLAEALVKEKKTNGSKTAKRKTAKKAAKK